MHHCLKNKSLLFVLFDKGCGFSVLAKSTYREKLEGVLNLGQFQKIK